MPDVTFSVIIPILNSSDTLRIALGGIFSQTRRDFEVIVVDDGSNPGEKKALEEMAKESSFTLLRHEQTQGPAAARNTGSKRARGEVLVFVDADIEICSEWLERAKEFLAAEDIASGSFEDATSNVFTQAIHLDYAHAISSHLKRCKRSWAWSSCMALRARVFEDLNGFDTRMIMCEDSDLSIRATEKGKQVWFEPSLCSRHHHRRGSFGAFLRHRYEHGLWEAILNHRYRNHLGHARVFPRTTWLAALAAPLLAGMAFAVVMKRNLCRHPQCLLYAPLLLIGRMAWACGVVSGTKAWNRSWRGPRC